MSRRMRPLHVDGEFDDDDDAPLQAKKKKKKKKSAQADVSQKIGSLRGAQFDDLPSFQRVLWQLSSDKEPGIIDEAAAAAVRKRLGLRVPDVRRLPCKFWQRGLCSRGEACSFAHTNGADDNPTTSSLPALPPPVSGVAHPGLPRTIGRAMLHLGLREPSPIQAQAWPAALCGHDLLCRAPTGSGKTLAYLLPAMAHALAARPPPAPGHGPVVLILVPTRELAMQVHGVARRLWRPCAVKAEAVYGGEPREEQAEALESGGIHLLVATTGRLVDMLLSKQASLRRCTLLVLDEADQLLTLGFTQQVNQILGQLRPDRQTLLLSATLSERLEVAAGSWLKAPMRIYAAATAETERASDAAGAAESDAADGDDAAADDNGAEGLEQRHRSGNGRAEESEALSEVPKSVEQRFVLCQESGGRSAALIALLQTLGHRCSTKGKAMDEKAEAGFAGRGNQQDGAAMADATNAAAVEAVGTIAASKTAAAHSVRNPARVLCFVNEIKQLKKLSSRLRTVGMRSEILHGEKSQRERDDALQAFRSGKTPVLLTSDLASRGLDIAKLPAVINFDPPSSAAQYVHRAGRTGRQGAAGLVVTLLRKDPASRHLATQVRGMFKRAQTPLPSVLAQLSPPSRAPGAVVAKAPPPAQQGAGKKRARADREEKGSVPAAASAAADGGGCDVNDLLAFAAAVGQ